MERLTLVLSLVTLILATVAADHTDRYEKDGTVKLGRACLTNFQVDFYNSHLKKGNIFTLDHEKCTEGTKCFMASDGQFRCQQQRKHSKIRQRRDTQRTKEGRKRLFRRSTVAEGGRTKDGRRILFRRGTVPEGGRIKDGRRILFRRSIDPEGVRLKDGRRILYRRSVDHHDSVRTKDGRKILYRRNVDHHETGRTKDGRRILY